ncbi:hypothetical protein AB0D14_07065 [Streptomyces sp. NPDC048484]|uniref:hypothetical protein n=1 Tax=Streptomyces sp. NPDC048484 TaxID=3155146 RepID=UPI003442D793
MAVLAVLIPVLMLGVVLALGRYEEWLLPDEDWLLPNEEWLLRNEEWLLQIPPVQQPAEAESTVLSS